jgi:hypothetical protein
VDSKLERPYRKNLKLKGLIYFGGEEQEILVKNLSITGILVELSSKTSSTDIKTIFNNLKLSTTLDIYLPELRLVGEIEVIRVDMQKDTILLASEFKNVSFEVDPFHYHRKAYRKRLPAPGKILLNGKYHTFTTVNVSVDGLMIRLDKKIDLQEGAVTLMEFKQLDLYGEIKIVWVEHTGDNETIAGVKYVNLENTSIKGIPRFFQ